MRSDTAKSSRLERLRAVPWGTLMQGGLIVGARVSQLSAQERAHLTHLLRQSRGWPANLGVRERRELGRLVERLDLTGMTRELTLLARTRGKRR